MSSALWKVEGAGNDFLLGTGSWAERVAAEPDLAVRLCDRRRGVGADGVLALEPVEDGRVRLVYRNADGSLAPFCANATRCAARAAVELLSAPPHIVVETGWGAIPAQVNGTEVTLELPAPGVPPRRLAIAIPAAVGDLWLAEIGVPHLIVPVEGLAGIDLESIAPPLRRHPALGEAGANVDFFEMTDPGHVSIRTWERGVEGETLACGSGAVAVGLFLMSEHGARRLVFKPRSGDRLVVEALGEPPDCPVHLIGPARLVAAIDPAEELLAGL
ncbi:MAG: diaminopimelate epimerase [Acidobacteriota bacterium]